MATAKKRGTMQPTKPTRQAQPDQAQGSNTQAKTAANAAAASATNQGSARQPQGQQPAVVPTTTPKVDPLTPPTGQSAASATGPIAPTGPDVPDPQFKPGEVVAYQSSMLYGNYDFPRYNSDALVGRQGLDVYDRMLIDEQVKAVMHFKRDAITAREWSFKFDDGDDALDDDEKQRRIMLMTVLTRKMKGSFVDGMNYVLKSLQFGYSLTEKVYDYTEVDGQMYYYCKELQSKPLKTFYFVADQYGTMTQFYQLIGGFKNFLDIKKFIYYVHQPEEDWLFGRSELRAAYRSWFSKDVIIKLWNIWMERMAGGFLVVTRSADSQLITVGTPEYADLKAAISNVTTTTSMLLPSGFKVELVTPQNTDQFEKALVWHNSAIAKSQLVPNLLGVSEQGSHGSLAQSQTQLEAFMWTLANITQRLQDVLDEQLFRPICEQNFGDGLYPTFKFSPISDAQLQWIITQWTAMVGAGALHVKPEDEVFLRKILNFPSITPDEIDELDAKKQEEALATATAHGAAQGAAKAAAGGGEPPPPKGKADGIAADTSSESAKYRAHTHDGKPRVVSMQAFSRACARVDFTVIEHRAEMITGAARQGVAAAMAKGIARQLVTTHLIDLLSNAELVGQLAFDKTDIARVKQACRAALTNGYNLGRDQAQRELASAKKQPLRAIRAKFGAALDDAAGYFEANAFRMAGNLTDGARSIIQQELLNAIKSGSTSADEIRQTILGRLLRKGFTNLQALSDTPSADAIAALQAAVGGDVVAGKSPYVDTLVRTNVFEAFNEARYEQFKDPALDGFVQALEYSAILDDHTTEICQELDGATWADDSSLWDKYRPPNHYNCRSILVPVTALDGWDGTESPEPTVEPQDGFGAGEK